MIVVGLAIVPIANPCIPVSPYGQTVAIAGEHAIIVWNPLTKTEYFVREAEFRSSGEHFGFLVPTPSKPNLTEGDNSAFSHLDFLIAPKTVVEHKNGFVFTWFESPGVPTAGATASTGAAAGPVVLGRAHVSGYEAVILRASDAGALAAYLKKNGYVATKEVREWLEPYVKKNWVITAFKVNKDAYLKPVCMAFKTDKPFYPYKEPMSPRASRGRVLRVYFISNERHDAVLQGRPWNATVPYSSPSEISSELLRTAGIVPTDAAGLTRLTIFEDHSNPRKGTEDLYFQPGIQDVVTPPPFVQVIDRRTRVGPGIWMPGSAVLLGFAAYALVRVRRRKSVPNP